MDLLWAGDLRGFVKKHGTVERARQRAIELSRNLFDAGERKQARNWVLIYFQLATDGSRYL